MNCINFFSSKMIILFLFIFSLSIFSSDENIGFYQSEIENFTKERKISMAKFGISSLLLTFGLLIKKRNNFSYFPFLNQTTRNPLKNFSQYLTSILNFTALGSVSVTALPIISCSQNINNFKLLIKREKDNIILQQAEEKKKRLEEEKITLDTLLKEEEEKNRKIAEFNKKTDNEKKFIAIKKEFTEYLENYESAEISKDLSIQKKIEKISNQEFALIAYDLDLYESRKHLRQDEYPKFSFYQNSFKFLFFLLFSKNKFSQEEKELISKLKKLFQENTTETDKKNIMDKFYDHLDRNKSVYFERIFTKYKKEQENKKITYRDFLKLAYYQTAILNSESQFNCLTQLETPEILFFYINSLLQIEYSGGLFDDFIKDTICEDNQTINEKLLTIIDTFDLVANEGKIENPKDEKSDKKKEKINIDHERNIQEIYEQFNTIKSKTLFNYNTITELHLLINRIIKSTDELESTENEKEILLSYYIIFKEIYEQYEVLNVTSDKDKKIVEFNEKSKQFLSSIEL